MTGGTIKGILKKKIADHTAKGRLSTSKENAVSLHADQTQQGDISIALSILKRGPRRWWVVSTKLRPLCTRDTDPVPIVQEVG